jgi:hypothetical protein
MGWCSGTQIFDAVLNAALPHITDKAARDRFVYQIAVSLWDGDWDCESDSDYYEEFQHVLDGGERNDRPWTMDPAVAAKFPHAKRYQKTYVTPAIEYTGHNFDAVRDFCDVEGAWGLANENDTFGNVGPRTDAGDGCAVYDYLHRAWIPFAIGDHIAEGPAEEHYPIEATILRTTYREVFE